MILFTIFSEEKEMDIYLHVFRFLLAGFIAGIGTAGIMLSGFDVIYVVGMLADLLLAFYAGYLLHLEVNTLAGNNK